MPAKTRLDQAVVERGWADNIHKAQAMIMAGLIRYQGQPATQSGTLIAEPQFLELKSGAAYVSRGGDKLAGALSALSISVTGRLCLDVGSSTGGFTDCLLQAGARAVWALDVGDHLLHEKLRKDLRVKVFEKTHIRDFQPEKYAEFPNFVTVDVSFISLAQVFPVLWKLLSSGSDVLALVKPQFEASPKEAPGGVVVDEDIRQRVIEGIEAKAKETGFQVLGRTDSVLEGPKGNREAFLYLKKEISK